MCFALTLSLRWTGRIISLISLLPSQAVSGLAGDLSTDNAEVHVREKKSGVRVFDAVQVAIRAGIKRHKRQIVTALILLLLALYFGYFG